MKSARADPRVVRLRDAILGVTRQTVERWSADASVGDVGVSRVLHSLLLNLYPTTGSQRSIQSHHRPPVRPNIIILTSWATIRAHLHRGSEAADSCMVEPSKYTNHTT